MSLVDAARRLRDDPPERDNNWGQPVCAYCWRDCDKAHANECPWRALPQIVAAMEAADVVIDRVSPYYYDYCCGACGIADPKHNDDCPWQALRAALRGDS